MTTDNQDHNQAASPIEDRLRQTLHTRAEQVQPSPEAFFVINRRISRREAASPWHPRSLWEKRAQLHLQPSTVLSLLLLVALTAVTTILLTRENSDPEIIATNASSTENSGAPHNSSVAGEPEETQPEPTDSQPPTTGTAPNSTSEPKPGTTDGPVKVDTHQHNTPTTEPPTTIPPAPSLPDTASLLEVRPLQVASHGFPQIFAEYRTDSEYIGKITVNADPAYFKTASLPALDSEGRQWIEVISSEGDTGWVQALSVSVQPREEEVAAYREELAAAAQSLVGLSATVNIPEATDELKHNTARALPLSSRGVYVSVTYNQATLYGNPRFAPDLVRNYLLNATSGAENHMLQTLSDTLRCISQAQEPLKEPDSAEESAATEAATELATTTTTLAAPAIPAIADTPAPQAPAALRILNHTHLTNGADCSLLVYFDFLQTRPEIIAISIHTS